MAIDISLTLGGSPGAGPGAGSPFQPIPYPGFNFQVSFTPTPGGSFAPNEGLPDMVVGGFAEISGLEASMEVKAVRAGGRNYGAYQLPGPVTFGTVVLKRGVIEARQLWAWWSLFAGAEKTANGQWGAASRCDVTIALVRDGSPTLAWTLERAMPVKFRVGDLNAKGGEVAMEELHLVHEGLNMVPLQ